VGDLVIKIVEHFLPLFVGTYGASPYRIDFSDFHPEKVLAFLPHQLDYTHLRMLWRRWQKKASLRIFGRPTTPFGLRSLDRILGKMFMAKGDFVPDMRLIDYPVALMSTDRSPALNGRLENDTLTRKDLSDLGIFDAGMPMYLPYRLRQFEKMGFSGFEGRHYSLFESLKNDMAPAVELQTLITALAFKYVLHGEVTHSCVPDDPVIESERRQIFFGAAIGLPTFYVHEASGNRFLTKIIKSTPAARYSRRYSRYLRVYHRQYRLALAHILENDGADLVEMLGMESTIKDLKLRLEHPEEHSAIGRLTRGILAQTGAKHPLELAGVEFNRAAESYYRTTLKKNHIREAVDYLSRDLREPEGQVSEAMRRLYKTTALNGMNRPLQFIDSVRDGIVEGTASLEEIVELIHLLIGVIHADKKRCEEITKETRSNDHDPTPIHRAGNW
jgi:hypothetical protein